MSRTRRRENLSCRGRRTPMAVIDTRHPQNTILHIFQTLSYATADQRHAVQSHHDTPFVAGMPSFLLLRDFW